MITVQTINDLRNKLNKYRLEGKSIGFVPTMGYLHEGHLSLVRASKNETDITVVSLFVNPAQFGPSEDFDAYPRDTERDSKMLEDMDVDILFLPALSEIYPKGFTTYVEVEKLGKVLCGRSRENHFRGVTTVVSKLFNIVGRCSAYFGRKDAQQATIIKKMVLDLNMEIRVRTLPIVRDPDGLALSSRNVYLSPSERQAALCMQDALHYAEKKISEGLRDAKELVELISDRIKNEKAVTIDYVEAVSLDNLEKIEVIEMNNTLVAAAIRVGRTRLIDNFILGEI